MPSLKKRTASRPASRKSASRQKSPAPVPLLAAVIHDLSAYWSPFEDPGYSAPFWVLKPGANGCCLAAIEQAKAKGDVLGAFVSRKLAERLVYLVDTEPSVGEAAIVDALATTSSMTKAPLRHPDPERPYLQLDQEGELTSWSHWAGMIADRKLAIRFLAGITQEHIDTIDDYVEKMEAEENRIHAIAYCSEGPFSQRLFQGIVGAVADSFDHKEDVAPGITLEKNESENMRDAILAAIWIYETTSKQRAKYGEHADGGVLVSWFLEREGMEGSL